MTHPRTRFARPLKGAPLADRQSRIRGGRSASRGGASEPRTTEMSNLTVLIVPGLRDAVATHWQTLLEARLRAAGRPVASVPPLGREDLDCARKVAAKPDWLAR